MVEIRNLEISRVFKFRGYSCVKWHGNVSTSKGTRNGNNIESVVPYKLFQKHVIRERIENITGGLENFIENTRTVNDWEQATLFPLLETRNKVYALVARWPDRAEKVQWLSPKVVRSKVAGKLRVLRTEFVVRPALTERQKALQTRELQTDKMDKMLRSLATSNRLSSPHVPYMYTCVYPVTMRLQWPK